MMESKSLTGFMVTNYTEHFREYLPKLIGKIHSGEFQTRIDMGEQTSGGKFFGLEQVFRAEEVIYFILLFLFFLIKLNYYTIVSS